jgi:hypothetical protein
MKDFLFSLFDSCRGSGMGIKGVRSAGRIALAGVSLWLESMELRDFVFEGRLLPGLGRTH